MDYNELNEWSKVNSKRTYHALTNKILIATGYGQHEDLQKPPTLILRTLSDYENLHLISIKGLMAEQNIAFFQELWGNVIENPALSNLQGAIVSDNIELIAKLHSMMVPTLCIMNTKTTDATKKYIYSLASSGALLVTDDESPDEIILYMNTILNREWNLSITQRNSINIDENWFKRLLLISPPDEN
jgi:hypothetical protein